MLTLVLPYPISANRYWRPVRVGKSITIVPTKEAKAYRKDCGWLALSAGIRKPMLGRLSMRLWLYPHRPLDAATRIRKLGPELWDEDVQAIDLGNADKVICDALEGVVYENDKQLWDIHLQRAEPDGQARAVVVIDYLAPRATPQTSLALTA